MSLADLVDKFMIQKLQILETEHWTWSLRPHQATLGASILSLNRECESFSKATPDEYRDLHNVIARLETTLKTAFNYDVINYLMLMMFDKQVHFHVLPRYEKPVKLFGRVWKDTDWPAVPALLGEPLPVDELHEIKAEIVKELG